MFSFVPICLSASQTILHSVVCISYNLRTIYRFSSASPSAELNSGKNQVLWLVELVLYPGQHSIAYSQCKITNSLFQVALEVLSYHSMCSEQELSLMKQTPLEASYARLYEWVKSYFCSVVHAVLFLAIENWHQSCQLWLSNTSMRLLEWRVLHSLLLIGHSKMKSRTKGKEGVHKLWLIVTPFQGGGWARKNVASCILKLVFLLYLSYSLYMVFFVIDSILCSWVYFLLILSHYTIIQLHIHTTTYIKLHIYNYIIHTIIYTCNYIYI